MAEAMGRKSSAHSRVALSNAEGLARGFDCSIDGAIRDVEDLVVVVEGLDVIDDEAHGLIINENVSIFVTLACSDEERCCVRIEVGDE